MGGVLSKIASWFQGVKEAKILMLGLDMSGKTTILHALKRALRGDLRFEPTTAFNLETYHVKNVELSVWDLGGQDAVRSYWRYYYSGVHGLVFVIDSGDRARLSAAAAEFERLLHERMLAGVPLVVVANKQDLANAMRCDEVVEQLKLTAIRDRNWTVLPTTATKAEGVDEVFAWLADRLSG